MRYYIVHSVEIVGKHMFAVVNWMKAAEQDLGFGNSLSVWLAGQAISLPVQRIHFNYLCAEKLYSGQRFLIFSPIRRRILL